MNKIIAFLITFLAIQFIAVAQNEDDALRYSNLTFGGTARSLGCGGAFGAIGADFSTLSFNPAGIGLYKSSEFTFSPSMYIGKTTSSYLGSTNEDNRYNFNLGNVGMVLAFPLNSKMSDAGWKNMQFGFGINRTQNFNNRMIIEGNNMSSSLLDTWVEYANGNSIDNLDQYDVGLGFNTWVLDTIAGSPTQYKAMVAGGGLKQRKSINSSGSMNEWVMTLGGNYNDKLYFGATLGFPFLKYSEESTFNETALAENIGFENFREFTYHQNLETTGSGFNFKFGMIFKPADWVRLGASVHTPTYFYNMHDVYTNNVKSRFDNGDNYSEDSPEGTYDYKLNTPMRAMGSLAFIIGNFGFISADYEFVDYSESRFRADNSEVFFDVNDAIRSKYTSTSNLRVGTEWKYNEFNFRGGYALYGDPFKNSSLNGASSSYSVGFGMRQTTYFLDLAYVVTQMKNDYYLYYSENVQPAIAKNDFKNQSFIMTLGFRF